jgi:hypothetical protein
MVWTGAGCSQDYCSEDWSPGRSQDVGRTTTVRTGDLGETRVFSGLIYNEDQSLEWSQDVRRTITVRTGDLSGMRVSAGLLQ